MKKIDASTISKVQNYKLLTGSIIPRPIAFVTSQNKEGILNAAPFSFFNGVNSEPPMIMFSATRSEGQRKDTSLNIEETGEFVLHITDENNVEHINRTAAPLERKANELARTAFTTIASDEVKVPGVAQAKVRMECKLDQIIPLGDSKNGADLIIGEIVMYHIDDDVYIEDSKIDASNLNPVSRLAGNNYALTGKTFSLERPTE
ncbi:MULTISPECIES: flavin reductase family protein [Staphylococcus]|uniref:Flavin reductase family protein n=1 Tax=Staphylococcus hsinchuensis TaxID=3051183 RepID=A0ABZ3EEB8_9STAP|nr:MULTISPECIES: flavin reductase family protein [unclassified Staphylococcus]